MDKTVSHSHISGTIAAPSSKSFAQRAVAASLLCHGRSTLTNMGLCNDTSAALTVIEQLGAKVCQSGSSFMVDGGFSPRHATLNIGESGLATRLFTPIAALGNCPITITGHGSIMSRPIDAMCEPLEQLGVKISTNNGLLPLVVDGPMQGGTATADGSLSSQFITGLLMALPLAPHDTELHVSDLQSIPYIDMTIQVLHSFGITITHSHYRSFHIPGNQSYKPTLYNIEGDWSGASCMLVAGAIAGEITIENLNPESLQADRKIMEALSDAGAIIHQSQNAITVTQAPLRAFNFDATHCPDLFPALVALAANCQGVTTITGTERLTYKESDRAVTLAQEFGKLGIFVDLAIPNVMRVERSTAPTAPVTADSHNDHRIAMAAAVAALTIEQPVTVSNAQAVGKSYPEFWEQLLIVTNE